MNETRSSNLSFTALPDSAYARKVLVASVPLMTMLTFLLYETYRRSQLPPYTAVVEGEEIQEIRYLVGLKVVVFVFLWVATLCCILIIYALHTTPRKRQYLRKFLDEGTIIKGDVFVPEDQTCYGLCAQYGTITYGHPDREFGHSYIRRSVRLYQRFSREWISIMVLPSHPFSGHPKEDIEMEYLATNREKEAMEFLSQYASVWLVCNILASVYVLSVIGKNKTEDEFPRGWMWFGIWILAMVPFAFAANFLLYQRFLIWMNKGNAKILKENENVSEIHRKGAADAAVTLSDYQTMPDEQNQSCRKNNNMQEETF